MIAFTLRWNILSTLEKADGFLSRRESEKVKTGADMIIMNPEGSVRWIHLLVAVWIGSGTASGGDIEQSVFQIRSHLPGQAEPWLQSGFRLKGTPGIVTALHGVVGANSIRAISLRGPVLTKPLTIKLVDVERDLAVLVSDELTDSPQIGLSVASSDERDSYTNAHVWVHGFPEGVLYRQVVRVAVNPEPYRSIRESVNAAVAIALDGRGSPSTDLKVLRLQSGLRPGHSGAPVCNESNEVLAVANGGLKGGNAGLNWAVPLTVDGPNWQQVHGNSAFQTLAQQHSVRALFASVEDPRHLQQEMETLRDTIRELKLSNADLYQLISRELNPLNQIYGHQPQDLATVGHLLSETQRGQATISQEARRLGSLMPSDADEPLYLAVKAITEERFKAARDLLRLARDRSEARQIQMYHLLATSELYAGNYNEAIGSYLDKQFEIEKNSRRRVEPARRFELLRESADTFFLLGYAADLAGRKDESLEWFTRSTEITRKLMVAIPDSADLDLALAVAENSRGVLFDSQDNHLEALEAYQTAEATFAELSKQRPADVQLKVFLANTIHNQAKIRSEDEQETLAIDLAKRAIRIREQAVDMDPSSDSLKVDLADSQTNLGSFLAHAGRTKEAKASLESAVRFLDSFVVANPEHYRARLKLSIAYLNRSTYQQQTNNVDEAILSMNRAIREARTVALQLPESFLARIVRVKCLSALGMVYYTRHDFENAETRLRAALDHCDQAAEELTLSAISIRQLRAEIDHCNELLAAISTEQMRYGEASAAFEALVKVRKSRFEDPNSGSAAATSYAIALYNFGRTGYFHKSDAPQAAKSLEAMQRAIGILDESVKRGGDSIHIGRLSSEVWNFISVIHLGQGNLDSAEAASARAVGLARKNVEKSDGPRTHGHLGGHLHGLAQVHEQKGDLDKARDTIEEAIEHQKMGIKDGVQGLQFAQYLANHYQLHASISLQQQDAESCLRSSESRLAIVPTSIRFLYQTSRNYGFCVPLASGNADTAKARTDRAIELLQMAIRGGLEVDLAEDPAFESIRSTPEFQTLLKQR